MDKSGQPNTDFVEPYERGLLAAVQHDFHTNPKWQDELWHEFGKANSEKAKQLIQQANEVEKRGLETKFQYLQRALTPYALERRREAAQALAELVGFAEEVTLPTQSTGPTDLLRFEPPHEAA